MFPNKATSVDEQKKLTKRWEAKTKVEQQKRNIASRADDTKKEYYAERLKAALIRPEVAATSDAMHFSITASLILGSQHSGYYRYLNRSFLHGMGTED